MQVIERFRALAAIPRCSFHADAMLRYLAAEAERFGYGVHSDASGNLLCSRSEAVITLQAHYDMVCIGRAPELELYETAGWLRARESTLGADNGVGIAMMLELMAEGAPVECLFTAEEEVGLLGARALELPLKPLPMLNLDSEEEGIVTIGCAGGVDLVAQFPVECGEVRRHCYRVSVEGLPGGHSGVDIHRGIPNAIIELASRIEPGMELVSIEGGERRNSIPRSASAVVATAEPLEGREGYTSLGEQETTVIMGGEALLRMLREFRQGVRHYDETLGIVHSSINLALVATEASGVRVQLSARAMAEATLRELERQTAEYFSKYGGRVKSEGFYAPWEPVNTPFSETVLAATATRFPDAAFGAIHAGLECGVIRERYPEIEMASIGPNITEPHSSAEAVEIASVARVYEVVREVIRMRSATSL